MLSPVTVPPEVAVGISRGGGGGPGRPIGTGGAPLGCEGGGGGNGRSVDSQQRFKKSTSPQQPQANA